MTLLGPLLCAWTIPLSGQSSPIVEAVEPDYTSLAGKATFTAPVAVNFIIHPDGTPYTIDSQDGGLEEHVWNALASYRFQPSVKGLETSLTIPVRRAVEDYRVGEHFYLPPPLKAAEEAVSLDAASAKKLENNLPLRNRTEKRAVLLTYAATHDDSWSRQMRVRQLTWFLKNEPSHDVLQTTAALIRKNQDPEGYRTIKELWTSVARQKRYNRAILRGLTNFLRLDEPEAVRDILRPLAGQSLSAMEWYGELYGLVTVGVDEIDPFSGQAAAASRTLPNSGFGAVARSLLLNESQLPLLLSAFATMNSAARSLHALGRLPQGYEQYCERVLAKIRSLNPAFGEACHGEDPFALELPGDVMGGRLTKGNSPWCPAQAMEPGGTLIGVSLDVYIGIDGKVKTLNAVSGRPPIVEIMRRAVLQWEFEPYTKSGKPIEVFTTFMLYCRF